MLILECLNPSKYNWDTFRHGFDLKKKGLLIYVKLYQRHSFSRSESENEMARDREQEVKMKKKSRKRESRCECDCDKGRQ